MKKMFQMVRRMGFADSMMRWARRAAAAVVILAALSFGTLVAFSPVVRAAIGETITRWFDGFVNFVGSENIEPGVSPGLWRPRHLPAGFYQSDIFEAGDIFSVTYANAMGEEIWLTVTLSDVLLAVNIDGVNHSEALIGGITYHRFTAHDDDTFNSTIIWHQYGYIFELFSDISIDELQLVALSVGR